MSATRPDPLIEQLAPGVRLVAVRTPTLPPATHTNTWILGEGALTVVDPASPWEDEQQRLAQALQARIAQGERVERIVLTHHHADHVGGARALQAALSDAPVPIAAHRATADRLAPHVAIDEFLDDDQLLDAGGLTLAVRFTPGHAPGHVVLHDLRSGVMVAGDMVAGVGTILVEPGDGDLAHYLASLERMQRLSPSLLLPAHGPALEHPDAVLSFYIAHRHQRTDQIRRALDAAGESTPLELAQAVYGDVLPPEALPFAAAQVVSHLRWKAQHGLAEAVHAEERWASTRG